MLIGLSISFEVAGYFPKVGGEIEARLHPTFFGWGLGALVVGPGGVKPNPPPPPAVSSRKYCFLISINNCGELQYQ